MRTIHPQRSTELCSGHEVTVDADSYDVSLVELDPTTQQLECHDPPISELQDVDPSLVFLCYRGFNHISRKVQTGRVALTSN